MRQFLRQDDVRRIGERRLEERHPRKRDDAGQTRALIFAVAVRAST
jgi:hypothetical protein